MYPSDTKFSDIPHGNPAGIVGANLLAMTDIEDEAIFKIIVL